MAPLEAPSTWSARMRTAGSLQVVTEKQAGRQEQPLVRQRAQGLADGAAHGQEADAHADEEQEQADGGQQRSREDVAEIAVRQAEQEQLEQDKEHGQRKHGRQHARCRRPQLVEEEGDGHRGSIPISKTAMIGPTAMLVA